MKELVAETVFPFYFYGEVLQAALAEDRNIYIPIAAVALRLGVDASGQQRRLFESEELIEQLARIDFPIEQKGRTRMQPQACINVLALPDWMNRIELNRISADAREEVRRITEELRFVARAHFRTSIVPKDLLDELEATLPPEMLQYYDQMHDLKVFLLSISNQLGLLTSRLGELEKDFLGIKGELDAEQAINAHQAFHIQKMVQAIGYRLDEKGKAASYNSAYNTFKKQFKIPRYGALPKGQYEEAVQFLTRWCERLLKPGEGLPSAFQQGDQQELF